MSIGIQEKVAVIAELTTLINSGVFHRIVEEMKRVEVAMPKPATGAQKRDQVLADCKIIFDDLVTPIADIAIKILIEAGMVYLTAL